MLKGPEGAITFFYSAPELIYCTDMVHGKFPVLMSLLSQVPFHWKISFELLPNHQVQSLMIWNNSTSYTPTRCQVLYYITTQVHHQFQFTEAKNGTQIC